MTLHCQCTHNHLPTKFISTDTPTPDEINAINEGQESILYDGLIQHEDINWNE